MREWDSETGSENVRAQQTHTGYKLATSLLFSSLSGVYLSAARNHKLRIPGIPAIYALSDAETLPNTLPRPA